jgi:hypothetical protein
MCQNLRTMNNEPISRKSQTDWQRLDSMSDEDLDLYQVRLNS